MIQLNKINFFNKKWYVDFLSKKNDLFYMNFFGVEHIIRKFEIFFGEKWFMEKTCLPLPRSHKDKTLAFTNSAIISLKDYMSNWDNLSKYYIVQPCIRTQNLKSSTSEKIKYLSSFNMIWSFVNKNEYDSFVNIVYNYLVNVLKYNISDVKIFCSNLNDFNTLLSWWKKKDISIKYNDENYYWKFWEKENVMSWRWLSFRVLNKDWNWTDIGNFMEIVSKWKPVWYWLWLGVETLLSHKKKLSHPVSLFIPNTDLDDGKINLQNYIKLLIDFYLNWIEANANSREWKEVLSTINMIVKSLNLEKYTENNSHLFTNSKKIFKFYEEVKNFSDYILSKKIYLRDKIINWIFFTVLKKIKLEKYEKTVSILVDESKDEDSLKKDLENFSLDFWVKYKYKKSFLKGEKKKSFLKGEKKKSITFSISFFTYIGKQKFFMRELIEKLKDKYTI